MKKIKRFFFIMFGDSMEVAAMLYDESQAAKNNIYEINRQITNYR